MPRKTRVFRLGKEVTSDPENYVPPNGTEVLLVKLPFDQYLVYDAERHGNEDWQRRNPDAKYYEGVELEGEMVTVDAT